MLQLRDRLLPRVLSQSHLASLASAQLAGHGGDGSQRPYSSERAPLSQCLVPMREVRSWCGLQVSMHSSSVSKLFSLPRQPAVRAARRSADAGWQLANGRGGSEGGGGTAVGEALAGVGGGVKVPTADSRPAGAGLHCLRRTRRRELIPCHFHTIFLAVVTFGMF